MLEGEVIFMLLISCLAQTAENPLTTPDAESVNKSADADRSMASLTIGKEPVVRLSSRLCSCKTSLTILQVVLSFLHSVGR